MQDFPKACTGRLIAIACAMVIAAFSMCASGCNTIEGLGEDVSAAGQTVADWAADDNGG